VQSRACGWLPMKAVARIGCCIHCCTAAHLPGESSQEGGSPQLLALRWLPPREPAIPVAFAPTRLGPLSTELSAAGGKAFQAFVPLTSGLLHMPRVLRGWPLTRLSEHDGLLICAIRSDARCSGVMVTIAPKQPSATLSHDLLILSDLHSHPLPARSGNLNTQLGKGADGSGRWWLYRWVAVFPCCLASRGHRVPAYAVRSAGDTSTQNSWLSTLAHHREHVLILVAWPAAAPWRPSRRAGPPSGPLW
jgi:hypothetical protein